MRKECTALALAGVLLLAAVPCAWPVCAQEAAPGTAVDIVFTHDTHSHLNTFTTMVDGLETELGGFARMNTLIEAQRAQNPDTLVIDGGDFSMGTLIQTVFVPAMVVCNVDWDTMEAEGLTEGQQRLKDAFAAYGVSDYTVLEKSDVDIAVVGVFGKDALACAPTCELKFEDPIEAVKQTVADIKANEDVDMIVCVSHSGTWEDESKSEDELLAKAVPDLDLILSGHTHTELEKPIQHGSTYVVSCGEYGKNLGELTLTQQADGRWAMSAYELIPITSDIAVHAATQQTIDSFMDTVDTDYLARFGYTKDQVLAENDIVFSTQKDLENIHEEHNLGDIIADAYVYAVENAADYDGVPVDLAVVPSGTVRDTYARGDITVEQVFNSFSLGIGADGVPGYPLISVYLTGREIRTAAEIDASVSDFMTTARLYCSGLNFTYNPHRLLLNRVTDVCLEDDGQRVALEDDKLYRIVADLYSGQMLSAVTDMSYGILAIVPKYADGTPITDFKDVIITENGRELKAWDSIARYMASFADTDGDGIANVPAYYSTTHGRKLVDTSRSPLALLKNPNKFTAVYAGLLAVAVLLIVLVVLLIRKLVKKARRRTA